MHQLGKTGDGLYPGRVDVFALWRKISPVKVKVALRHPTHELSAPKSIAP